MIKQDQSTSHQANIISIKQDNYLQCINQLKYQNNCKKQALNTAQNLIKTYQYQNQHLKKQNKKLLIELEQKNHQIEQLQLKMGRRQPSNTKSQVFSQIKLMAQRQQIYQEKIRSLQSKIFLLQRQNKSKDPYKNKNKIFVKTEIQPQQNSQLSLFYNPRQKTKNVHKNLNQLRNLHIKMKKRNDQINDIQQMNITTQGRYQQTIHTNISSSTQKPKTPQRFNTPKKKIKATKIQWK